MRRSIIILALGFALFAPAGAARAQQPPPIQPPQLVPRETPFPDVPVDHWAYDAVEELRRLGILIGYPPSPRWPQGSFNDLDPAQLRPPAAARAGAEAIFVVRPFRQAPGLRRLEVAAAELLRAGLLAPPARR